MNDLYKVEKYVGNSDIIVRVPGSKSITNRALLLAALSAQRCLLKGVLFSDDTFAMLDCLLVLGFRLEINEAEKEVLVYGGGGKIPNNKAEINVRSAGTAARFLTVVLGVCGGEYVINSSGQMKKRPMAPVIEVLRSLGTRVECLEKEGYFPLKILSEFDGKDNSPIYKDFPLISVDTNKSSQFASALLMAGTVVRPGLTIKLCGERTGGAYINLTLKIMAEFGIDVKKDDKTYTISHNNTFGLNEYLIEPDISAACYFYAMAPLLKSKVLVKNVFRDSLQGDLKFLYLLEKMGCKFYETEAGICLDGKDLDNYNGAIVDMQDFSDQVLTLAAIAPFAGSETKITNVAHIRYQESDRLLAAKTELQLLGVDCDLIENETGILIKPLGSETLNNDFEIETYEDHRIAMAFTLIGLKTGRISIKNPGCSAKTFADYFTVIDKIAPPGSGAL